MTHPTLTSPSAAAAAGMPTGAIVGRPNVGKSTLFNRLVGTRRAIVGDEPGITRDRLYGEAEWRGRRLRVVDTGGIIPEDKDLIPSEIFRQARVALDEASVIVMVVDGRSELTAPDIELTRLLRKIGKPLLLAVNKIDTAKQESLLADFHRPGVKEIIPISAEHGSGIDDLLDAVLGTFPRTAENQSTTEDTEVTEEQSKRTQTPAPPMPLPMTDDRRPTTGSPTTNDQAPTTHSLLTDTAADAAADSPKTD